jgi:hypothetical protein
LWPGCGAAPDPQTISRPPLIAQPLREVRRHLWRLTGDSDMDIRRIWLCRDVVLAEGGVPALMRVTCVSACAVIANPFSGRPTDDLAELVPFGAGLGELLVKEALALLTRPAIAACRSPFPPLDITTTVSGLLCWRDFHPQE